MNTLLIVVTALALTMAGGMAVVVVMMLRHERSRSEARIEALSALAAEAGATVTEPVHASRHFAAEQVAQWRQAVQPSRESSPSVESTHRSPRIIAESIAIHEPSPSRLENVDDFEIRPAVAGVADLFAEPERPSPWANRLVAIGCFAAIVLAIGVALTTLGSGSAPRPESTSTTTAKAKAEVAPLELLSLRHTQEPDRIVVSGLVQNPRSAAPIAHVAATVFVFGPGGTFLSSNQAPLDYTTLTPGGESQFVVSVPVTGQVSRYRVGFRTEDGQVLPHVDKRAPDALAQK